MLRVRVLLEMLQRASSAASPPFQKVGGPAPNLQDGPAHAGYRLVTFAACRPLGPFVTSNSTAWPSLSDL